MFKRQIQASLQRWAASPFRKPLVIRGARQTGKTTVVNEFAKEFDTYLYINLENPQAAMLFEASISVADLLSDLLLYCNKENSGGRILVFIDEIQNSPAAVQKLRYFYEERPDVYVIAAGSLLERLLASGISFPVGRVEYLAMHPCSFLEFLNAMGEDSLCERIKSHPTSLNVFHDRLMLLLNRYALIGGMPEVVARYAATRDVVGLSSVLRSLLEGYRDDSEKYAASKSEKECIRTILRQGWGMAGSTITFSGFGGSNYGSREIGESFRILEKAMLLELVYPSVNTTLPIITESRKSPKLLWLDIGLVNFAAGNQREVFGAKDLLDVWRGRLAEQLVGQELLTLNDTYGTVRAFWVRNAKGSEAEVDFVCNIRSTLIPIEVKAGVNSRLRSLHSFVDQSHKTQNSTPCRLAVRIWSGPYSSDTVTTPSGNRFILLNVPFYLIGALDQILDPILNESIL
ncbi:MAG: AAA family ATPase [Muribaculaceae bacterium]|nr:AAA family ATPase [Muribaculaceae bacterium]